MYTDGYPEKDDSINDIFKNEDFICLLYSGIKDKLGNEIYADDILEDEDGTQFRIYLTAGGFATKQSVWFKDISDLKKGDELVLMPCAQTKSWLEQSCTVIENYHEMKTKK